MPKYNAFISYRHNPRDTAVASLIQTDLERFHLPEAIQKKTGVKKISRIFRDQNELELAADLGQEIDTALEESDALIVICSPAYKESKWCLHEIDQFLKTHDRSRVFTVLSEGEPPDVFPEQLLHKTKEVNGQIIEVPAEPLACDYRMDFKDARRYELPRLVSGMIGCEYDDLFMRNEKWRRGRIIRLLSVIGVLVLAAIAWLMYSNARISENYRRAQISESRVIAAASLELESDFQRLSAMRTALSALPAEEERPVTSEAMYALAKASLAYTLPWSTKETAMIDLSTDIQEIMTDEETHKLIALDQRGMMHIYDTDDLRETASFVLYENETSRHPVLHEGHILSWTEHGVVSYDEEGNREWEMPLMYGALGTIAVSGTGRYAAAADIYAVEVLTLPEAEMAYSLRLSDPDIGYIFDLCWSDDDASILALVQRSADLSKEAVLFDTESGKSISLGVYDSIAQFGFDPKGHPILLIPDRPDQSFVTDGGSRLYENTLHAKAFDREGNPLYDTEVPFTITGTPQIKETTYRNRDALIIAAGDTFSILDAEDGSLLTQRHLNTAILKVQDILETSWTLLTADGCQAVIWDESGDGIITKIFPDRAEDIEMIHEKLSLLSSWYVLRDGNVHCYTACFDPDLHIFPGKGFPQPADEAMADESGFAVRFGKDLVIYDAETEQEIFRSSCPEEEFRMILNDKCEEDRIVLFAVNLSNGRSRIETRSIRDGSLLSEKELRYTDALAAEGLLLRLAASFADNTEEAINLQMKKTYAGNPPVQYRNGKIIAFTDSTNREIEYFSPEDSESSFVKLSVPEGYDILPLNRFIADQTGEAVLMCVRNTEDARVHPAIVSLKDGSAAVLENTELTVALTGAFDENGRAAVGGTNGIDFYDAKGQYLQTVQSFGQECASAFFRKGILYALYPNGRLDRIDSKGTVLSSLQLSLNEELCRNTNTISMRFYDPWLIVQYDDRMDIIDLSKESTRPEALIEKGALLYLSSKDQILVSAEDVFYLSSSNHPALFKHYSCAELIQKAKKELGEAEE